MGEERDRLIRRLGAQPLSEETLSDGELMARRMEGYGREGRLPPEIQAIHDRSGTAPVAAGPRLVVGYGTLLNRSSEALYALASALDQDHREKLTREFRDSWKEGPEQESQMSSFR